MVKERTEHSCMYAVAVDACPEFGVRHVSLDEAPERCCNETECDTPCCVADFNAEQLEQLMLGAKDGVNIVAFADPSLSAEQMQRIRKHL